MKVYQFKNVENKNVPDVKIISRDIIADTINAYSDRRKYSKEQMIQAVKDTVERYVINIERNLFIDVKDAKGNDLANFLIREQDCTQIQQINIVLNNET
jgi:hypothetical protein